eukprot:CAMPEP_0183345046 /NCGR_PEP_ID=MMETSP0164_2-20130417/10578_1 /TAXON_ID=221442 /ORGANISM="Coccolithus pelagicus ssp braarudi, Strain PLY182g" /LENGTH=138 /DNA_ID=CAMNT_0025516141 /DNA_START=112 /DNA_END=524 /DNA_ORIENTATION=-
MSRMVDFENSLQLVASAPVAWTSFERPRPPRLPQSCHSGRDMWILAVGSSAMRILSSALVSVMRGDATGSGSSWPTPPPACMPTWTWMWPTICRAESRSLPCVVDVVVSSRALRLTYIWSKGEADAPFLAALQNAVRT